MKNISERDQSKGYIPLRLIIRDNMKIGIYIGSFNPPHKGHKKIINYLLTNKYVDKILIIPTGNYWHKQNLINIKDRINMLKYYENKKIKVDTLYNNYQYTYQILRELIKKYNKEDLYLILGADNIINFDKWDNFNELLTYNILIVNRDNIDVNSYIKEYPANKISLVNGIKTVDICSTTLRNNLKYGKDTSDYIDRGILDYIVIHKLYK